MILILKQSSINLLTVGYTMSDIRYKWNDGLNSVQISSDVSLPQFKVLGHRQKTIEASLSTGINIFFSSTGKTKIKIRMGPTRHNS